MERRFYQHCIFCASFLKKHQECILCSVLMCFKQEHMMACTYKRCYECFFSESNKNTYSLFVCLTCKRGFCMNHITGHELHEVRQPKAAWPKEEGPMEWIEEGVFFKSHTITMRNQTCQELWEHLKAKNYILVQAPKYTGKKSLSQLFASYLKTYLDQNVFSISRIYCLTQENSEIYSENTLKLGFKLCTNYDSAEAFFMECEKTPAKTFVIIIDDAQKLFKTCPSFFEALKKASASNVRVLCFAEYGINQAGTEISVPVEFNHILDYKFLRVRDSEFWELISNYKKGKFVKISDDLAAFMRNLARSHMGIIKRFLHSINTNMIQKAASFNNGFIYRSLISCKCMVSLKISRCFESEFKFNLGQRDIIKTVLIYKRYYPSKNINMKDLTDLVVAGFLTTSNGEMYKFASPVIGKIYLDYYTRDPWSTFKIVMSTKIIDFITAALPEITGEFLILLSTEKDKSIRDRLWRFELYHAIGRILATNFSLSLQIPFRDNDKETEKFSLKKGSNCMDIELDDRKANMDFYIDGDLGWAIDIIHNATRNVIQNRLRRFMQTGKYSMVNFRNYLVIDLREDPPDPETLKFDKYSAICYNPDLSFESLKVFHLDDITDVPLERWKFKREVKVEEISGEEKTENDIKENEEISGEDQIENECKAGN